MSTYRRDSCIPANRPGRGSDLSIKIGIAGGGPAGLYFALLMKQLKAAHEIRLLEQNSANATYGWGVVFSDRAVSFLENSAPDFHHDIKSNLEIWDKLVILHKGQPVAIDGSVFSGISRIQLFFRIATLSSAPTA